VDTRRVITSAGRLSFPGFARAVREPINSPCKERCSGTHLTRPARGRRTRPSPTVIRPLLIRTSLTSTSAGGQCVSGLAALAPARPRFSWVLASRALASQSPRRARPPMAVSYPRTAGVGASLAVPVTRCANRITYVPLSGTTLVIAARADTHAQQGILAPAVLVSPRARHVLVPRILTAVSCPMDVAVP